MNAWKVKLPPSYLLISVLQNTIDTPLHFWVFEGQKRRRCIRTTTMLTWTGFIRIKEQKRRRCSRQCQLWSNVDPDFCLMTSVSYLFNISEKTLSAAHRKQVAQWALEKECCDVFCLKSVTVVDEIEEFVWKSEGLCHESGNSQARGRSLGRTARSAWSVAAGGHIFRLRWPFQ